jgi:isocitrate lyase
MTHRRFAPIVADAEAGFGGNLNAYELMRAMIESGAAGVHFEDQLASAKKCGHMGGKVLVPTQEFVSKLQAARLAADTMDVPTVIIARTDALGAYLLTSDIDERDRKFCSGERTVEGFYKWVAAACAGGCPGAALPWRCCRHGRMPPLRCLMPAHTLPRLPARRRCKGGIEVAIDRGLSYAPHADLVWFETGEPNMEEAREFAAAIHAKYPGALLCRCF